MVRFNIDLAGKWVVISHLMEHNHPLCDPENTHLMRSHRVMNNEKLEFAKQIKDGGTTVANAYRYLKAASGGKDKVGFTLKDLYDALAKERLGNFYRTDANTLMEIFKKRNNEEKDFYYDFKIDEKCRLTSFFWRDGKMKDDYKIFGDLVVHDTTYRTNKYNMICAPFVGMNNHGFNIMFGCGFLINERKESFIWLFETFLKSMDGMSPQTIMTDQCPSMANAIDKVFPNSTHRLCVWHLMENAKKKINKLLCQNDGFNDEFQYILKKCNTVAEFNNVWTRFVEKHKCGDNSWLQRLYEIRQKWCRAFTKDYFSGGVLSSQRSETTNNSISRNFRKTSDLCQFYTTFCSVITEWREKEQEEDFKCSNGKPDLMAEGVEILLEARTIYTNKIYKLFETEFIKGLALHFEVIEEDRYTITYSVWKPNVDIFCHSVQFNTESSTVFCSCKMITEVGILCRHCLRILNLNCDEHLDEAYILNRWRRKIPNRERHYGYGASTSGSTVSNLPIQTSWIMMMSKRNHEILVLSASNEKTRDLCDKAFKRLKEEVVAEADGTTIVNQSSDTIDFSSPRVQNPQGSRTKGQRNDRWKSPIEKIKKRAAKKTKLAHERAQTKVVAQTFTNINEEAQSQGVSYAHPIRGGNNLTTIVPDLGK